MNPNVDLVITDILLAIHGASPRWLKLETPPRHSHGLIYVKSGRAEYRFTDGRRFEVKSGDLFFLPKNSRYQGRQLGEETYTFVYADFETARPDELSALGLPAGQGAGLPHGVPGAAFAPDCHDGARSVGGGALRRAG